MRKLICILGASAALAASCFAFADKVAEPALLSNDNMAFEAGVLEVLVNHIAQSDVMPKNTLSVVIHSDHTNLYNGESQLLGELALKQFQSFDSFSFEPHFKNLWVSVSDEMVFKSSGLPTLPRQKSFNTRPTVTNGLDIESSTFGFAFG